MQPFCYETGESRRYSSGIQQETVELRVEVRNATNLTEATICVGAKVPGTWAAPSGNTLRITNTNLDEKPSGSNRWVGSVVYNLPDWGGAKQTGESVFNFDLTGGTQHIDYSRATVGRYSASGTNNIPDLKGGINDPGTGPTGIDINVPRLGFTATKYLAATNVTGAYLGTLYNLVGKVNDADYAPTIDGITLPFLHSEVLFLGVTGSRRGAGDIEASFHFAAEPNVTNLTVGGITGIAKKGWEYLWCRTQIETETSGTNTVLAGTPLFAYVEQIYLEGNFTAIGL